jgi:hypothetical protein
VASDRRFGLPHPFDADPTGEASGGRKPGLWETLKRALGTPPEGERAFPAIPARDEPARQTPAVPARPAMPVPPTPDPVEPSAIAPAREAARVEVDSGVPFLEEGPGGEEPPSVLDPPAAREGAPESTEELVPPDASPPRPPSGRLARGLASFSRDNAEREKRYAHLLRDAGAKSRKRSPGSRKQS